MQTSETLSRGDVVVVPFPYAEALAEKRRPAVVVSGPAVGAHGLVWIVMITSSANRGWDSDIAIADLAAAGLSHPSVIRPVKVACIARERVVRVAGKLDLDTAGRLRNAIAEILND